MYRLLRTHGEIQRLKRKSGTPVKLTEQIQHH